MLVSSEANNTEATHNYATSASKGASSIAFKGGTIVSSGGNGVGKIMMSKVASNSSYLEWGEAIKGLTSHWGEDTVVSNFVVSACKGAT